MEPTDRKQKRHHPERSSRLPGFYELPIGERGKIAGHFADLSEQELADLASFSTINPAMVDVFIENGIGTFSLPLGVATNFQINRKEILIPMAVEETSVLAAASHGAKMAREGGGFVTESTAPIMTGQIQIFIEPEQLPSVDQALQDNKAMLVAYANRGQERLLQRGGGVKDMSWRYIPELEGMVIHVDIDTRDAMGANIVNTICERISSVLPEIFSCDIGLRILTNLTDKRLAKASCRIPASYFTTKDVSGAQVVDRIIKAYLFADHDIYRAATHNKGVMNGIDPVVIATGNDWRAVEAGAHAYACRTGRYRPLTKWWKDEAGDLRGQLELPMAVGTVGGVTKLHPTAQAAMRLLGNPDACQLAEIICAVGLAQNLSALRALASEGIQRGHMSLHQKNLQLMTRQGASKS